MSALVTNQQANAQSETTYDPNEIAAINMHAGVETWMSECACVDPAWAQVEDELEERTEAVS